MSKFVILTFQLTTLSKQLNTVTHFIPMTRQTAPFKRAASSDMRDFFPTTKHAKRLTNDPFAEYLGSKLDAQPVYLTDNSWYVLAKAWMPPASPTAFNHEWNLHPKDRHALKMFGKTVYEKRWSQSWGVSYSYSGSINQARPNAESEMVLLLLRKANELTRPLQTESDSSPYNGCLQNWYEPDDTIGLHSDDEKAMRQEFPIFSLSWGGTRRFLFIERKTKKKTEVWLENGDLLVMGGTCQETHHHEVPKRRVTMDPPTSNRINWTIRAFREPDAACRQATQQTKHKSK